MAECICENTSRQNKKKVNDLRDNFLNTCLFEKFLQTHLRKEKYNIDDYLKKLLKQYIYDRITIFELDDTETKSFNFEYIHYNIEIINNKYIIKFKE